MDFGAQLQNDRTTWDDIATTLRAIDAGRWRSAWLVDHFVPPMPGRDESEDCLEGWSMLAGAAMITSRVRLGVMVSGITYRNPALLAKMAATIDQMSGGRLELGIGAAWHEREHEAYGWVFPSAHERSDRLEEACALIRMLFRSQEPVEFDGRYYRLHRAPFAPKCLQTPHAPIMVGGGGPKRTLRTLARYGDTMNVQVSPEEFARLWTIVERHCYDVGRDPAEIRKTVNIGVRLLPDGTPRNPNTPEWIPIGSAQEVIDKLGAYVEIGVDEVIPGLVPNRPEIYEQLDAEVISAFV